MSLELQELSNKAVKFAMDEGAQYCDIRAEKQEKKSILVENQEIEHIKTNNDEGIGIRLIKNGVWSFSSITNPKSFEDIQVKVKNTIRNSLHYTKSKKNEINLFPNSSSKIKIDFPVFIKPELEELTKIGFECSKIISNTSKIIKSIVDLQYTINSKYFVNSEGSEITQNFTDTIVDMIAIANESGVTQSINTTEGGRGGLEQIANKIHSKAKEIAINASRLIDADTIKEDKGVVVMNPDFVSLLTHEILGHPSEADRVLGKEMAWAGGAWWKGKIGEKIGSKELNVFDDPTIKESLGWYDYDDEGVKTKKTTLVENGILKKHMQNRETAEESNTEPTGNMRATNYRFMPLIRMGCTCMK